VFVAARVIVGQVDPPEGLLVAVQDGFETLLTLLPMRTTA
jgi:hypothetical protein